MNEVAGKLSAEMDQAIAAYVLQLAEAAEKTHTAADRSLYEKYLADAGALLAHAVAGMDIGRLTTLLHQHDRLLGNTWLQGPEHKEILATWHALLDRASNARAT
jgi:hypothetical protein